MCLWTSRRVLTRVHFFLCVLHTVWKVPWLKLTPFPQVSVILYHSSLAMAMEKNQNSQSMLQPPFPNLLTNKNSNISQAFSFFCLHSSGGHNRGVKISSESIRLAAWLAGLPPLPDSSSLSTPASLNVICTAVLAYIPIPSSMREARVPLSRRTIASCVPFPVICPSLLYWKGLPHFLLITQKQWFSPKMGSPGNSGAT